MKENGIKILSSSLTLLTSFQVPSWTLYKWFSLSSSLKSSWVPSWSLFSLFCLQTFKKGGKGGCVWQIKCSVQTAVFKECSVQPQYSRMFCKTTVLNLYITLTIISVNLIDWLMKIDEGRWRAQFELNSYQLFKRLFIVSSYPLGLKSRLKENIESENSLYIGDIQYHSFWNSLWDFNHYLEIYPENENTITHYTKQLNKCNKNYTLTNVYMYK